MNREPRCALRSDDTDARWGLARLRGARGPRFDLLLPRLITGIRFRDGKRAGLGLVYREIQARFESVPKRSRIGTGGLSVVFGPSASGRPHSTSTLCDR